MPNILAWHWCTPDRKLRYGDGREIVAGQTITHNGPIRLCESGLHASTKIIDALRYAPGFTLTRVRLSGTVMRGDDKIVATERHTLWIADATRPVLVWCAETAWIALHRVGSPDPRSIAAVHEVLRQQRSGMRDTGRLRAAYGAADAAYAAYGAAYAAAYAAYAADAAYGAADAYAAYGAYAAARAAAYADAADAAAERARQSKRLRQLIAMERRGELGAEIKRVCKACGVSDD